MRTLTLFLLAGCTALLASEGRREEVAPGIHRIEVRGEGEALGRELGRLLGPEIREVVGYLNGRALGPGPVGWAMKKRLVAKLPTLERHIPERYRAELRGMAAGAGVSYQDLLLENCLDDLLHHAGCSSVVLTASADGSLLHGRNLDYRMGFMARHKVVVDLETRGRRLRMVTVPGHIGALTAMSDRGLSLTNHTSRSRRNGPGEPTGLLYRRLLEESDSLGALEAGLRGAIRPQGNNLAVADARSHEAWALEFDAGDVARREATQGRLFVTNHYWCEGLSRYQTGGVPAWGSASLNRLGILQRALPAEVPLGALDLQRALAIHKRSVRWETPSNNGTVLSVVMAPATGRLWLAQGLSAPVTRGGFVAIPGRW